MKILVIREFDKFSRILAEHDYEIINFPLIETKPLNDLSDFEIRLNKIEKYDGIFLTSRNSAQILAEKLREKKIAFSGKVYILGKQSFNVLKTGNLDLFFDETINSAQELLEKIPVNDLKDKSFLLVQGDKSLRLVPQFLSKYSEIDEAIVYETRKIAVGIDKIDSICKKFEKNEIAAVCFFSPSGAESFLELFSLETLQQTKIATIGKTTAVFFEALNLKVDFIASKSSAENFAVELIEFLSE